MEFLNHTWFISSPTTQLIEVEIKSINQFFYLFVKILLSLMKYISVL